MVDFTNLLEAYQAIRSLEHDEWDTLPEKVQQTLNKTAEVGASPVDRIVKVAEAIYANRVAVSADAAETAAGLFFLASMNGWHGVNDDDRATKAAAVLRGDDAEAPEPKEEYLPAQKVEPQE